MNYHHPPTSVLQNSEWNQLSLALCLKLCWHITIGLGLPDTHFSKNLFQINELRLLDYQGKKHIVETAIKVVRL